MASISPIECKNEVEPNRESVNKHETGQMNNSMAWFKRNYPGASAKRVIIIPTKKVEAADGFNEPVEIMRKTRLQRFVKNVRAFFMVYKTVDFQSLSAEHIQGSLNSQGQLDIGLRQDW